MTLISLVSVATLAHAQGYIITQGAAANITTNTGTFGNTAIANQGAGYTTIVSGKTPITGGFDYALFFSTTPITDGPMDPGWTQVTQQGGGALGLTDYPALAGGITGAGTSSGVAVNMQAGVTYYVYLAGWSNNLGSSWTSIESQLASGDNLDGFIGWTGVSTMTPFSQAGTGDPNIFPFTFPNGSLVLYSGPVPEPTTLALAGLGGISMLLLRRRKS